MEDYKFGMLYEEKIKPEDASYFAKIFGEGSIALTELITYCILNNISTFASCKGHPEEKDVLERITENGYISFRIEDNFDFAYFLASIPHKVPGIRALVDYSDYTCKKSVTLYVPATKTRMSEEYFRSILEELRKYVKANKNNESIEVDEEVKHVVDWVLECPTPISFNITNNGFYKVERIDYYHPKVTKCPRGNKLNALHNMMCSILNKPKKVEELLPDRHIIN